MPGFSGTGPMGDGPMTGRGMGRCGATRGMGNGFGRGLGRGAGFRRGFGGGRFVIPPQYTEEERKSQMKAYRDQLKAELEALDKELEE